MTQAEALDKIKKLLRMQRGGTEAEIETALSLAAELARKYGINIDSVDPDHEPDQPIIHIDATTSARIGWECKYASLVCQSFFNVTALITQNCDADLATRIYNYRLGRRTSRTWRMRLIGTAWDTQIALYIYEFLISHMRRLWNAGPCSFRGARLRNRQAYLYGMYIGICSRLDEQKKRQVSGPGLILLGRELLRRDEYLKKNFGKLGEADTTPDCDATEAKNAGFQAGLATEIRSGISSNGKAMPLLT